MHLMWVIGSDLSQIKCGKNFPIANYYRTLNKSEQILSTTEEELAIISLSLW